MKANNPTNQEMTMESTTRYGVYNSANIGIQHFDTKEEADAAARDWTEYHGQPFTVKEVN